jgi:hypothetical protein
LPSGFIQAASSISNDKGRNVIMERTRVLGRKLLAVLLIAIVGLLAACGNGNDDSGTDDGVDEAPNTSEEARVSDDAPDPISVSAEDLVVIEEWRDAGVPRFRDGEVLDFEPHASQIENGGTLLMDGLGSSPEEIIGFYRGALQVLGWEERRVNDRELTAESDKASLLVTVSVHDDQTLIMMILTDRIGADQARD